MLAKDGDRSMENRKRIKPAARVESVQEYYFSVKLKEVARMNAAGQEIINLGIGSPDMPPSNSTVEALVSAAQRPENHGYQSYIGIPELRESFAAWYKRHYGVELNPSNEILPLLGSKEGIMHISMTFLNEGDSVLVPDPGYPTYASASSLVGAKIINYSLDSENGWQPNFEELEQADAQGDISLKDTKLMWCNYPNMPTGAAASKELFQRLVQFGLKHNIIICHDNPYSFILNENPMSILSVEGASEICIELNSLSKSSNMSGWRVGIIAANSQFVEWILRVKSNMDSGMFKPIQLAAIEALNIPDSWTEEMNSVYTQRRVVALEIMEALGAKVDKNQVGLFLWGKIEGSSQELTDRVLYQNRVFITPGFIFGAKGEQYIRISLCADTETLNRALNRIREVK